MLYTVVDPPKECFESMREALPLQPPYREPVAGLLNKRSSCIYSILPFSRTVGHVMAGAVRGGTKQGVFFLDTRVLPHTNTCFFFFSSKLSATFVATSSKMLQSAPLAPPILDYMIRRCGAHLTGSQH